MSSFEKNLTDFAEGVFDTFVGAPMAFGDFLARLSGFRDWQNNNSSVIPSNSNYYQEQAINEVKLVYEALTNEHARGLLKEKTLNDIKERPFYYLAGFLTGRKIIQTIPNTTGKVGYMTSLKVAKIDNLVHELLKENQEFYDLINDGLKASGMDIGDLADGLDKFIDTYNGTIDNTFDIYDMMIDDHNGGISEDMADWLRDFGDNIGDYLGDGTINVSIYDPLVLDLDGDGVSVGDGAVYFDHNGDGVGLEGAWIGAGDGLLARDIDGDGRIGSGAELFGNYTLGADGVMASDGFSALALLDSDANGVIDGNEILKCA